MTQKQYFIFDDTSRWAKSLLTIDEARIADALDSNETYAEVSAEQLESLQSDLGEDLGIENSVILIDGVLIARPSKFHTYDAESNALVDGSDAEKTRDVLQQMRELRTAYLLSSDWTQMSDAPLTDAEKAEWRTYRQALRELPQTYSTATDKSDITWPTKP